MKLSIKVKIKNSMGLHTRPATEIVKMLQGVHSEVTFTYKNETVNAKSILSILMLAVRKNAQLLITVEGSDAEETVDKLTNGFETQFGEA